jgi:hypothetical protein
MCATCPTRLILSDQIVLMILVFNEDHTVKLLILQTTPASSHFTSLKSKNYLKHHVIKHPQ